jgi:hypothetical protein
MAPVDSAPGIGTAVLIVLVFVIASILPLVLAGHKDIQNNWPLYRCDPRVMPFAEYFGHDVFSNFIGCTATAQKMVVADMLKPVNYNLSSLTHVGGLLGEAVQDVRAVVDQTRTFVSSITERIFGVFLNMAITGQTEAIKTKDLMGKVSGVMATLMYMLTGGVKVGESVMDGPIVGMMKTVCFSPDVEVLLEDGVTKRMADIELGDVLASGSVVEGTVSLSNPLKEHFYDVDGVKVTGAHLVRCGTGAFCRVRDFPGAKKLAEVPERLSCLVTSDHLIKVGGTTFWDYED